MVPRAVLYYADEAPLQDPDSDDALEDDEESDSDSEPYQNEHGKL